MHVDFDDLLVSHIGYCFDAPKKSLRFTVGSTSTYVLGMNHKIRMKLNIVFSRHCVAMIRDVMLVGDPKQAIYMCAMVSSEIPRFTYRRLLSLLSNSLKISLLTAVLLRRSIHRSTAAM